MILPVQSCRSTSQKCMEQKIVLNVMGFYKTGSTSQKCMEQKENIPDKVMLRDQKHFTEVHGAEEH